MRFLDSTFLIDLLAGDPDAARLARAFQVSGERLATPAPCVAELLRGVRRTGKGLQPTEDLLAQLEVVPLDERAARRAGEIAAQTAARGREVAMMDCLVAGVAISLDGTLVSRDSDFARIAGLTLETY
ncbi:protein containing PilT protein [mine drainage metagenome]|uniref:Protein containing PilT protein n=1 Tax=mine drainage metagenome TaxID=410659 RepID=T1BK07_9ZZZZ